MAKKRSCRRTALENEQHERAVKIRKMTDEQICDYVDKIKREATEECKEMMISEQKERSVDSFLNMLIDGKVKGIGIVTAKKISMVAKDYGFI